MKERVNRSYRIRKGESSPPTTVTTVQKEEVAKW